MTVAYAAAVQTNPHDRKQLSEAIFWVADTLEEEAIERNIPTLIHARAGLFAIKEMASDLTKKEENQWAGTEEFRRECDRLWPDSWDADDPA